MTTPVIEIAAQVGGPAADKRFLLHFQALKVASRDLLLCGFPFKKFGLIFRVDGEVRSYNLAGPGNVVIARRKGDSVSVDIGIGRDALALENINKLPDVICHAIADVPNVLRKQAQPSLRSIDLAELEKSLGTLCRRYMETLSNQSR